MALYKSAIFLKQNHVIISPLKYFVHYAKKEKKIKAPDISNANEITLSQNLIKASNMPTSPLWAKLLTPLIQLLSIVTFRECLMLYSYSFNMVDIT